MNTKVFENITGIGDLYLDKVLNTFEGENIVFVCEDVDGKYYFCICYEFRFPFGWVLTEITIDDLQKVLTGQMDMHLLYKNSSFIVQVTQSNEIKTTITDYEHIDKHYLPTEGVLLNTYEDES